MAEVQGRGTGLQGDRPRPQIQGQLRSIHSRTAAPAGRARTSEPPGSVLESKKIGFRQGQERESVMDQQRVPCEQNCAQHRDAGLAGRSRVTAPVTSAWPHSRMKAPTVNRRVTCGARQPLARSVSPERRCREKDGKCRKGSEGRRAVVRPGRVAGDGSDVSGH